MTDAKKGGGVAYGAAILFISSVAVKIIGAFFKIPLSSGKILGDIGFGYFSSAYDLFIPIYSLASAGLPVAVAKTVSEHLASGGKNTGGIFKTFRKWYALIGLFGTAVIAAAAFLAFRFSAADRNILPSFIALAPSFAFCCAMSTYRGYYEGFSDMYPAAVSDIIEALCKLFLGLGAAYLTVRVTGDAALGAAAAIAAITVGTAAAFVYLKIHSAGRITAASADGAGISAASIFAVVFPAALCALSVNMPALLDAVTLRGRLAGYGADELETLKALYPMTFAEQGGSLTPAVAAALLYGVKSKAYTLFNLVPTFCTAICISAVPAISYAYAADDGENTRGNISSALKLSAIISFPAGAGFTAAGGKIMSLLYDSDASFEIGGELLRIFGVAALFAGIAVTLTGVLQAVGRQKTALKIVLLGFFVKLFVNQAALYPHINVKASAWGTAAAFAVIALCETAVLAKIGLTENLGNVILKPFASAVLCGAAAAAVLHFLNGKIGILAAIIVAAAVYILALIMLNTFCEKDFSSFPSSERVISFCRKHRILR